MKRKSIITTIAACLCLCLSAGIFAACTDDNGGDGGEDKGTLYSPFRRRPHPTYLR